MHRSFAQHQKPIPKRANSKIVSMNGRHFLLGGMTTEKCSNDIYEFKIAKDQESFEVEWRPLKFENHIFTPRNSFAACASKSHIYIWGGLQTDEKNMTQKCLSDLIEVDIEKGSMREVPLKEKFAIHSACLDYDPVNHCLVAFGGTNETSTLQAYLYTLTLGEATEYEWKKSAIKNSSQEGYLWQHSANIVQENLLSKNQDSVSGKGRYLIVSGGCKVPHAPSPRVLSIGLEKLEVLNCVDLPEPLVAHESVYDPLSQCLYVVGGANGNGFNPSIYRVSAGGEIKKIEGHNAVGAACCLTEFGLVVYGGVCGPEMLNDFIIYHH